MLTLLRIVAGKAGWLLLSFLLIVAVLAVTQDLPAKVDRWRAEAAGAQGLATALTEGESGFTTDARELAERQDAQLASLADATEQELVTAERRLGEEKRAAEGRVLGGRQIAVAAARGDSAAVVASYRARLVELPLLTRAEQLVRSRRGVAGYNADVAAFNRQVQRRNALQRQAAAQRRYAVCRRAPQLYGCERVRQVAALNRQLAQQRGALRQQASVVRAARQAQAKLESSEAIVRKATTSYRAEASEAADAAGGHVWNQAQDALKRYSTTAAWILLAAVLGPILFKLIAFHLLAPLAARARPIRLGGPAPPLTGGRSAMSVDVPLGPGDELLLRSGLQSTAADVKGDDRYLLDWSMPFTCLAAGLVNLQRLRSGQATHIALTGSGSDFRVALIDVPADGAVALQPRALIGIRKPQRQDLRIIRPWRLGRLLSWLTFRFRYVVFYGPCTLIMEGRDGLMVEEAESGRTINRRLVLGFDAGLEYGAARSASFLPFFYGQASLFVDRFAGTGRYFYQQRAPGPAAGSIWGRGFKGIGDGLLKAFGI